MEICFLGTGAPWPDPLRGSSAILVETGRDRLLFDCGRACVQQMARLDIAPAAVTHCFLTHGHYDHIADYALLVLTSWRFGRRHTLEVYGPPGTQAMSDALFKEAYKIDIAARQSMTKVDAGADINIRVTEMRDGAVAEGQDWRVRAVEMAHWPIPLALGFVIEGEGKKIFFTGDTAPCDAARRGGEGADLLIHEAMYFPPGSDHYRSHTHPEHAGQIARQAGAARLVLTHLQPDARKERLLNDAGKEFTRPVVMAADGMRLIL